jgi:UDP-N-acetylglucosamine 2-epimerase (non-hydrolysing)
MYNQGIFEKKRVGSGGVMRILFIYGTRPEAIKMAPLIHELKSRPKSFEVQICLTGQHREMLDQVNSFFGIESDFDLDLMKPNQTLYSITEQCLHGLERILEKAAPDLVFVQGDTTTVMASSIAAYYRKIPVAHLEAGLRSGDKYSPFPEEINRKIAGQIAEFHFAPTREAAENLRRDGIEEKVFVVGNTVIDALLMGLRLIDERGDCDYSSYFSFLDFSKRIILVTGHRRENFGKGLANICTAIRDIASSGRDVEILFPVHLNPNVQMTVNEMLKDLPNIHLIDPISYPYMIWIMSRCSFVMTDSGGIQEEAPALGKPVLVMRNVTERMEGVEAGTARMVGTDSHVIIDAAFELLDNSHSYMRMARAVNPYGDGHSSGLIADILEKYT